MVERARAKDKCTGDSDSKPSVVSRDVLEDTAIGVGELDTEKRSVGLNKNTRRAVHHHKTRHKDTFVNGQIQLGNGTVTASPTAKAKVKGKGKGKRKHPGKGNHNQDQAGSPNEET